MVSPQESVRGRRGRVDSTGSELYADHVSVALENLVGGEDPGHRAPRKQTLPRADRVVMSSFKIALRCQRKALACYFKNLAGILICFRTHSGEGRSKFKRLQSGLNAPGTRFVDLRPGIAGYMISRSCP